MSKETLAVERKNSMKFSDHTGMLHKIAKRGWARLQSAGVEIEYEDVFQSLCVTFVQAEKKFDPTKGIGFTAYFGRACWNNFNKMAETLIREQMSLGLIRMGDFEMQDEDSDISEYLSGQDEETPEQVVGIKQEMQQRLAGLSLDSKLVVKELLSESPGLARALKAHNDMVKAEMFGREINDTTISFIGKHLKMDRQRVSAVRAELARTFDVAI